MNNIKLKDLKLKEIKKEAKENYIPKWLGNNGKPIKGKIESEKEYFYVYDENGKKVYYENSNGFWCKSEYEDGKEVYYEDSKGDWCKIEDGKKIKYEDCKYYIDDKEAELIK